MRFFGYYVCHTFLNQLKKLCKTWVLIFLVVCMVMGGLIGFGGAMLSDMDDAQTEELPEEIPEEVPEGPGYLETLGLQPMEVTEMAVGLLLLAFFTFEAIGADKNGSRIFLPADVNLLFASPMKPQTVLMFRLGTQLGLSLVMGLYLLIQLPNLVYNLGLSMWAALSLIATWCLAVAVGKLLQVLLYTVCSTHTGLKVWLRRWVYGILALILLGFFLFWKVSRLELLTAGVRFVNSPVSNWIPIWGWLKGFCSFGMTENIPGVIVTLAALILSGIGMGYVIWHIRADFYEDAMAKSEQTAELMERAQSEKTVIVKRKKDRSDKLRRDGMRHGRGANVYFHKAMYNRFRFAHLGIFTKTSETYLAAAVGVAALCRFVFETDAFLPVMLTLGAFVFFRAMGNPLEEDTDVACFVLIPESTWKKLFWSLMGGVVNCLLDLLPAMAAAVILLGINPLKALVWLPLILSVDFFATTVGAFINLSVPVAAGKMVKQLVQVMFIYFGLLPDVAIMAVGIVTGRVAAASAGAALLNILLGTVFLCLTPLFLEPKDGKKFRRPFTGDLKLARRRFSRLGLGAFLILVLASAVQIAIGIWAPRWYENEWGLWICNSGPIYLVGLPVGMLLFRTVPAKAPEKQPVRAGWLVQIMLICVFLMYAGNLLGSLILGLLGSAFDATAQNPLVNFVIGTSVLPRLVFVVILAPLFEEFIFRRQIVDRTRVYGEKVAILVSGLSFGLFHGNLSQFFYAAALGIVFAYVYLRTGRLRWSIGLHMLINFIGSVVAPTFLEHIDFEALDAGAALEPTPWLIGFGVYVLGIIALSLAGMVLFFIRGRKAIFREAELELPEGRVFSTVCLNPGMILLFAACLVLTLTTFL